MDDMEMAKLLMEQLSVIARAIEAQNKSSADFLSWQFWAMVASVFATAIVHSLIIGVTYGRLQGELHRICENQREMKHDQRDMLTPLHARVTRLEDYRMQREKTDRGSA